MSSEQPEDRLRDLLARAFSGVAEQELRAVVGELIRNQLADYQCKQIVAAAVEPLVRELVKEVLKEPAVLEMLRARALAETHRLIGTLTVTPSRY